MYSFSILEPVCSSKVIQLCIYMYPFFYKFVSHLSFYIILSRVPCLLVTYLNIACVHVNLKLSKFPFPPPFPSDNLKFIL